MERQNEEQYNWIIYEHAHVIKNTIDVKNNFI